MSKSYSERIEELRQDYNFHVEEAKKFKKLLDAAGISISNPEAVTVSAPKHKDVGRPVAGQATFETEIIDILKRENRVLPAAELRRLYTKHTGKVFEPRNFSSKLSIVAKKKGTIQNQELEFQKFYWGLPETFSNIKAGNTQYAMSA